MGSKEENIHWHIAIFAPPCHPVWNGGQEAHGDKTGGQGVGVVWKSHPLYPQGIQPPFLLVPAHRDHPMRLFVGGGEDVSHPSLSQLQSSCPPKGAPPHGTALCLAPCRLSFRRYPVQEILSVRTSEIATLKHYVRSSSSVCMTWMSCKVWCTAHMR